MFDATLTHLHPSCGYPLMPQGSWLLAPHEHRLLGINALSTNQGLRFIVLHQFPCFKDSSKEPTSSVGPETPHQPPGM